MLARSKHPHTQAAFWMVFSCLSAAIMISIVRHVSTDVSSSQTVFFRNLFALIMFAPWVWKMGWFHIKTQKLGLHTIRALNGLLGMMIWFYALTVTELPVATALSFTGPLFNALLAMVIFKEVFGVHRWFALIVGFIGCLVIVQPGTEAFDPFALLVMASTILWALSSVFVKFLSEHDSPMKITFYLVLFMTPLSLPFALLNWQPVPAEIWLWLIGLGVVSNFFQVAISKAISLAPFYVILPFDFTRLLFVSVIAYIFFDEVLTAETLIGALLILGAAVYSSYREARKNRKRKKARAIAQQ